MSKVPTLLMVAVFTLVGTLLPAAGNADLPDHSTEFTISTYNEAPLLAAMVADGRLPPVETRLPSEPMVIQTVDEVGQYGGRWTFGIPKEDGLGVYSHPVHDFATRYDPRDGTIKPNVLRGWETSADGRTITMSLHPDMKWSDGHPFTAEDIMFWLDDIIGNHELTPHEPIWLQTAGKLPTVIKLDGTTLEWGFATQRGLLLGHLTSDKGNIFAPMHYLKQFHKDYGDPQHLTAMVSEAGFEDWTQLFKSKWDWYTAQDPSYPVLNPWVVRTPFAESSALTVYERNPYYWKIDQVGNQLPYLDEVAIANTQNLHVLNSKAIAGDFNFQFDYLDPAKYQLVDNQGERANYRLLPWQTGIGSEVALFFNQSYPDVMVRELFQDLRFRQALSLAIDREEINQSVFYGDREPGQATVVEDSALYRPEYAEAFAHYDPDQANDLLDEIGLTERDQAGFRLGPNGTSLTVFLDVPEENFAASETAELVASHWRDVGVNTATRPIEYRRYLERRNDNEAQVAVQPMHSLSIPYAANHLISTDYIFGPEIGKWYATEGADGQEPADPIKEALAHFDKIKGQVSVVERNELFERLLGLQAQNLWILGTVSGPQGIRIARNDFRNVPDDPIYDIGVGPSIGSTAPEQYFLRQPSSNGGAPEQPVEETSPLPLDTTVDEDSSSDPPTRTASRAFAAPQEYTPDTYAIYSIVAFPSGHTSESKHRYLRICEGYVASVDHFSFLRDQYGILLHDQIVIVWPISIKTTADILNDAEQAACDTAVESYDMYRGRHAIDRVSHATGKKLDAEGPYLIAWGPSAASGESIVVVDDLSSVTTAAEATRMFRRWRSEVEKDPTTWKAPTKFRDKVRRWFDRWGTIGLEAFYVLVQEGFPVSKR